VAVHVLPSKPKTASGAIPTAAVRPSAEESAAKWRPACASPTASAIQARAVPAFVIVSMVVKVFDATITSVVAGSSFDSVSWICAPSTFETKWTRGPSW
jgi:hypothetical protein